MEKFKAAKGRKLHSLEAHDLLCKIGEVVVVGGVRRSAMISLSDLSDDRMAHAKAGNWWDGQGQRALANNSAVYNTKPDVGQFMREWSNIYESHSGERGIFNRYASELRAAKNGRRELGKEWGTNPCSEIILRPYQFCNLCEQNVSDVTSQEDLNARAKAAAFIGTLQAGYTDFHYLRPIWQDTTEKDALLGVSMTGIGSGAILGLDLEQAAKISVEENKRIAAIIGINPAARVTAVKPAGTTSLVVIS